IIKGNHRGKSKMKVVICGGGIVGNLVAYYLVEHGIKDITILESHTIANAASGNAGGFLAKDWCSDNEFLDSFAKTSYSLHQTLAAKHNGEANYDYRVLEAFSATYKQELKENGSKGDRQFLKWVDGPSIVQTSCNRIGSKDNVAQLHPYKFVKIISDYNASNKVKILEGNPVVGFEIHNSKVTGVKVKNGSQINCDVVILCMGPWTGLAVNWFVKLPSIYGQKGHSIVISPEHEVPAEALFMEFEGKHSPEIYPRPDGNVYVCGATENPISSSALPQPGHIMPSENSCEKLKTIVDKTSNKLKNGQVMKSQACYLPLTQDGLPIIGRVPKMENVYVGAGHGCWGILNAPATGKALAQLITNTGEDHVNIDAFDPARFN
uniref:FAD dependent oxidoreductase domain-containing protein n=1 Tax=Ciona savignyi TaxID=51511 RepID=H2ZE66_CIOSA